jgi:hypothetical protein
MHHRPVIMVLEASSANPPTCGTAESDAIRALGEMLNVRVDVRPLDNRADLMVASRQFNLVGYSALYVVAHGSGDGVCCSDGALIGWPELASLFDFKSHEIGSLILSSCSTLVGDSLITALTKPDSAAVPPRNVFGFKTPLSVRDSVAAGCLLLRAMEMNDSPEIAAAMAAICLSLKIDMWFYVRNLKSDEYDYQCGGRILDYLINDIDDEKGWRKGLLEDRGLSAVEDEQDSDLRGASATSPCHHSVVPSRGDT